MVGNGGSITLSDFRSMKIKPPNEFYRSYRMCIQIVNDFDFVKYIRDNKEKILSKLVPLGIPNTEAIKKIQVYEKELDDVKTNKFSSKIISEYVLPLISHKKTEDKFDSLLAISMFNTEQSGKLTVTEILDNEVVLFGKK